MPRLFTRNGTERRKMPSPLKIGLLCADITKRYAGNKPELSDISRQHRTESIANRSENPIQCHPEVRKFARAQTALPQQTGTGSPDRVYLNQNLTEQLCTVRLYPLSAAFLREIFRIAPNMYLAKFIKQRKPRICLLSANFRHAVHVFVADFHGLLQSVKHFLCRSLTIFAVVFVIINRDCVGVFLRQLFRTTFCILFRGDLDFLFVSVPETVFHEKDSGDRLNLSVLHIVLHLRIQKIIRSF